MKNAISKEVSILYIFDIGISNCNTYCLIYLINIIELKVIQNEFRKTKSFKVSKLGPHYEELEKTMLSSAHSSTRNNIIIYGLPGFGRKSAVRYAIRSIHSSE